MCMSILQTLQVHGRTTDLLKWIRVQVQKWLAESKQSYIVVVFRLHCLSAA